jgi:hypothetical protein
MPKKQRIYVDRGIEELVENLNQIEGVETCGSCEGHGNRPIDVGVVCTVEAAFSLMKLALKRPGVSFRMRVGHRQGHARDLVRATLCIGSIPAFKSRKHELKEAFLKGLRDSGLLTKNFSGKVLTQEQPIPLRPVLKEKEMSKSENVAMMTPRKFKLLCEFVCKRWQEQVELLCSQISQNFFHTSMGNLPTLSGDVNNGNFSYEPNDDNFWNIEWEKKRIRMYLILGYGYDYYVTCPADIANIPHLQGEAARILPQILAD